MGSEGGPSAGWDKMGEVGQKLRNTKRKRVD